MPAESARVVALLVAGGRGARFGGDDPKQFAALAGRPLVAHAAAVLDAAPGIDAWIAVAAAGLESRTRAVLQAAGATRRLAGIVTGGDTRRESVWNGLQAVDDAAFVLVHDAARPLLTARLVRDVLAAARTVGAATVALPVSDTLFRVRAPDGAAPAAAGAPVVVTADRVDRDRLWSVQTPQAFATGVLRAAHARAREDAADTAADTATDDCGLVLAQGGKIALVPGPWWNLKVTDRRDLRRAEILLALRAQLEPDDDHDVHGRARDPKRG